MKNMSCNFLIDILIDPLTGEQLVFDDATNTLSSPSGNKYSIIESVPQIIVDESHYTTETTLHKVYRTKFKYRDHYQRDAEMFDYSEKNLPEATKDELRRLHESILREVPKKLSVILDVGCGDGWVSKKLVPAGHKVISMDISVNNPVNSIKEIPHSNHAGLTTDVYYLPFKENSLDCIIASEILEHAPDPYTFISNLIKALRNNGKLIITTPYNEKIEYSLCVHCNKPTPRFAHLNSFNEKNIGQFIPENGITWHSKMFLNKYLIWLRSLVIMKFLPFRFWNFIDRLFNIFFFKPTRLQIVIKKNATGTLI